MRRHAVHALVLVVCAVTRAGAEGRPDYGGTIEAALLGGPVALDPVTAQSHAEITVVGLVFDTLYTVDLDGTVEPHLAVGVPELDAARTMAHIALRRGVAFHDATLMTAGDVAASLERARTAVGWVLAPVASIRASGDGVDVELRQPVADLAALLALPQTAITRRGKPPTAGRPIGSGPFAVDSLDPANKRLVLKAFDDHFAGRAYLDQLVLRWFDTPDGEARAFETGAAQLSARGVAAFVRTSSTTPPPSVQGSAALLVFIGFGKQHPAVTGERVFRIALDLALDRGALEQITSGELTRGTRLPLPIEAGGVTIEPAALAGDAAAARVVLADAGKRSQALSPASLTNLKLTIVVDETRPDDHDIALAVSRGLGKLGIDFTIDAVGPDKLRERVARGDCDLWIGQLAAPIPVATAWWGAAFAAGNDSWAQQRLAAGGLVPSETFKQFASHLPIIPLMFRSLLIWHNPDVRDLRFDASGRPGLANLYRVKPAAKLKPKGKP